MNRGPPVSIFSLNFPPWTIHIVLDIESNDINSSLPGSYVKRVFLGIIGLSYVHIEFLFEPLKEFGLVILRTNVQNVIAIFPEDQFAVKLLVHTYFFFDCRYPSSFDEVTEIVPFIHYLHFPVDFVASGLEDVSLIFLPVLTVCLFDGLSLTCEFILQFLYAGLLEFFKLRYFLNV